MPQEIIRRIVQRILTDKILLGLVVVGILAVFIGGMSLSERKPSNEKIAAAPVETEIKENKVSANAGLTPELATQFIKWWLTGAMDYNAQTAGPSHNQASAWMTPETISLFQSTFWAPDIANNVASGRLSGTFQPNIVKACAINPDGSIVVSVDGTLALQADGQPVNQPFQTDFLVRQAKEGLRVAGFYNHLAN
jgi:hypothetical protein